MIISKVSDRTGIIQSLEDLTSTQSASTSSYPAAVKLKDINLAFDDYQNLVKQVSGTWQADDSNHTKYPNMYFNLVSGQSDYNFTFDEQGNQVQDIYRVECMQPDGTWKLLTSIDEMQGSKAIGAIELESGTPLEYWKTANGIFLKVKSNYSQTNGIRMFFTRSPNYFTTADVTAETKVPGIPNGHHKYLFWKPAYWYWLPKDTNRANLYRAEVEKIEKEITEDISNRNRDEKVGFRPRYTNYD
jgi:hypothetical protein